MSSIVDIGNSYENDGDMERRKKATFEITVFAIVNEPAYEVLVDTGEKQAIVQFSERTHGDANSGDDEVLEMRFGDPATLLALSNSLANAGRELRAILAVTQGETKDSQ